MIQSTMQDTQLALTGIFKHGAIVYSDSEIVTCLADGIQRSTFAAAKSQYSVPSVPMS